MKCVDIAEVLRLQAGQISTADAADLDRHFAHCDRCGSLRDEVTAMAARMAPDPNEFEDPAITEEVMALIRLGRAESSAPRRSQPPFWRHWQTWLLVPATAAVTAVLLLVLPSPLVNDPNDGFRVRSGSVERADRWVSVKAFRLGDDGFRPVQRELRASDTLAFTYLNRAPLPYRFLMVLAVDHRGEIYWYYPAHREDAESPASIEIEATTAPMLLPQQVRHELVSGPLRIFGLFSATPLDVKTVEQKIERQLAEGGGTEALARIDLAGTGQHSLLLHVVGPTGQEGP